MGRDGTGEAAVEGASTGWPLREGGRAGLVAILTLWTRGVLRVGILKGLGLMLPVLQDQFVTKTWVIGWIVSTIIAFSGVASKQFECQQIVNI